MLKKEQKDKLTAMGLDIDAIISAHNDTSEKDIKIPEGQLLTDAQLLARDEVKVKEGEKIGEKQATVIAKTEIKKHAGIELKGERWGDIGKELKDSMNADKDTKVTQLQEQNTLLLADVNTYKGKAAEAETALNNGMFKLERQAKLPPHKDGLSATESLAILEMRGITYEKTDTGVVWKKGGEVLKDPATHAPLAEDKAIAAIWAEQKWTPAAAPAPQGGRGAQQKPITIGSEGIKNKSQAEAAWNEANPDRNMNTPEGMAFYNDIVNKTPDFNMYE